MPSGLRGAVGRGIGAIGAFVDEGCSESAGSCVPEESVTKEDSESSRMWPFSLDASIAFAFGFVIGMAALAALRVARADWRARW